MQRLRDHDKVDRVRIDSAVLGGRNSILYAGVRFGVRDLRFARIRRDDLLEDLR